MTVFNTDKKSHIDRTAFFDTPVDVARYDTVKYPQFEKLTEKQMGFFWKPEEVELAIRAEEIHILPQVKGAGKGGILGIIVGVVLIIVGIVLLFTPFERWKRICLSNTSNSILLYWAWPTNLITV